MRRWRPEQALPKLRGVNSCPKAQKSFNSSRTSKSHHNRRDNMAWQLHTTACMYRCTGLSSFFASGVQVRGERVISGVKTQLRRPSHGAGVKRYNIVQPTSNLAQASAVDVHWHEKVGLSEVGVRRLHWWPLDVPGVNDVPCQVAERTRCVLCRQVTSGSARCTRRSPGRAGSTSPCPHTLGAVAGVLSSDAEASAWCAQSSHPRRAESGKAEPQHVLPANPETSTPTAGLPTGRSGVRALLLFGVALTGVWPPAKALPSRCLPGLLLKQWWGRGFGLGLPKRGVLGELVGRSQKAGDLPHAWRLARGLGWRKRRLWAWVPWRQTQ